jgi:hypothetical protein
MRSFPMPSLDLDTRLGLIAVLRPDALHRLEAIGVDLALEHDRTLGDACAMRDVDARFFLADLLDDDREGTPGLLDWAAVRPARTQRVEWHPAAYL